MRAVLQRVRQAQVAVGDRVVGRIGAGLLVLVGVEQGDGPADVTHISAKIRDLRVFDDDGGADGRVRMPTWAAVNRGRPSLSTPPTV